MNVSDFMSEISKFNGFAHQAKFKITFTKLPEFDAISVKRLTLMCDQVEFPGKNIKTFDKRYYGNKRELPISTEFTPLVISFVCGNDMEERRIFERWITLIQNRSDYDIEYPAVYYGSMSIQQLDDAGEVIYTVNVKDVFPKDLNAMQAMWSGADFHRITLTLTYNEYDVVGIQPDKVGLTPESTVNGSTRVFDR